jgi:twitching motility two-component system response regulator PilH
MANEILIADADKTDQEEFQRIFESTDYHLIFLESGEEALLRIKLFKPDMIIASGTGLREMGGLELCGVLKGDPEFKHIPFLLISDIFTEISEKDRQHARADGVISKPLDEDEVLNLVDHLMEMAFGKKEKKMEEFLLDEIGEDEEEEIIELTDVVEEPETKMSIHDFITTEKTEKEESFGEITPLESWEKLELDEKPLEKEWMPRPEKGLKDVDLELEKEGPPKEPSPEEELFRKIELEEILEKVEQLKPSLEREWPSKSEAKIAVEEPFKMEELEEKPLNLKEFEAALQKEVKADLPEAALEPFLIEEPKGEISEEIPSVVESVEEEELKELSEEEFPEEFLEEILGEEEISAMEEPKEVRAEEIRRGEREEVEAPPLVEEEVRPLVGAVNKQMQEVISQKVQEIMEEVVKKLVPEMTQNVVGLTVERVEKMVRKVVPDLAEKAIQEEIKRLQKGEKE